MRRKLLLCAILVLMGTIQMATAAPQSACTLPAGLSEVIASKYPGAHVVSLPDLDQDDKKLFQKEHGSDCPVSPALTSMVTEDPPSLSSCFVRTVAEKHNLS